MTRHESAVLNIQTGFAGSNEIELIDTLVIWNAESISMFESLITILKRDGINSKNNAIILIQAHLKKLQLISRDYPVGETDAQ